MAKRGYFQIIFDFQIISTKETKRMKEKIVRVGITRKYCNRDRHAGSFSFSFLPIDVSDASIISRSVAANGTRKSVGHFVIPNILNVIGHNWIACLVMVSRIFAITSNQLFFYTNVWYKHSTIKSIKQQTSRICRKKNINKIIIEIFFFKGKKNEMKEEKCNCMNYWIT